MNNAGILHQVSTMESTHEIINSEFAVNVFGAIYVTKAVVNYMPRGGRIINIGSVVSKLGLAVPGIYSATKAAMDSLTFSWAAEVSTLKLRKNLLGF